MSTSITVVQSLKPASLCKRFDMIGGKLHKTAIAHVTKGNCRTLPVPTARDMVQVLAEVTASTDLCVVPGLWHHAGTDPFDLVTEPELCSLLGTAPGEVAGGVHALGDRRVGARLKRGIDPSIWMLIDADDPPGIPDDWKEKTLAERLEFMEPLIPGISTCERIELRGSSARVVNSSGGPGRASHAWVRVNRPELIETLKARVAVDMVNKGVAFPSPRYSRVEQGKVIGHEQRTVIDLSVWTTGRIVFNARPELGNGMETYTLADPGITLVNEGAGELDISAVKLPDIPSLRAYHGRTGVALTMKTQGGAPSVISKGQLTMDTEISSRGTTRPLSEWIQGMEARGKLRCEAPFRASQSEAAVIRLCEDGTPVVHDVGNGTTYHLAVNDAMQQQDAEQIATDADAVALKAEAGDVGAPFDPAALATLRELRTRDLASWVRLRERMKRAGVGVTELDKQVLHGEGAARDEEDETVADKLIALARQLCRFVHDAQGDPYAVFEAGGARQVYGVQSRGFSDYLSHAYYSQFDRAPTEQSLKVALATLRGQAQFEGEEREVFTRIAKTDTGYWLDLCNDAWQCVQITATGWAVVTGDGAPLFTRSASMRPLPVPVRGGTLDALWPLVNIPELDRPMVLAWMLECLRPDTPHVVLELVGEQGSAKSFTQKLLRRLIDPNQANLRAAPKSVEDVWVAARNSHMVSLENLSHLNPQYQDALCVLATGGGYSTRTLYTNADETILELRKPIVLNGISVIVTAQDLLDRCLHIDLPTVQKRELESVIEERYEAAQPGMLGAFLDLFASVLAALPSVSIEQAQLPRMADFAVLGEAVFMVQCHEPGAFLDRYNNIRKEGVLRTIDASPVGSALTSYMEKHTGGFEGTLSDLLRYLDPHRPQHGEGWPKSGKGLGDALRRLAPALRLIGYECRPLPKTGGVIRWHLFSRPQPSKQSPASPASPGRGAQSVPRAPVLGGEAGHAGHAGHGLGGRGSEKGMPIHQDADEERL